MRRSSLVGAACALSLVGCFPDPPAVGDVADTQAEVGAETEVGEVDVAEVAETTEDVDASGGDDAMGETEEVAPADTVERETVADVEVEVDVEVVDTAEHETVAEVEVETADIAVDEVGDTVVEEVEVVVPECEGDEGCAHLDATCRAGVCQEGTCVEEPLTGEVCDDGDRCTEGDVCDAGACVGEAVICQAKDQCHDAGVCDPESGECSDSPLSGVDCDDGLVCTSGDGCIDGVCAGEAVVCVAKDQCHEVGVCDPGTGACTEPRKPDTTPCDDGLPCTEADRCELGVCVGVEVVCQPIDDCHEPGVCDPGSGVCSTPASVNGTVCDDGDFCTVVDACSQGACFGSGSPDDSAGDFIYVLESDGDVEIHALAVEPDGSVIAIGKIEGTSLSITAPWGVVTTHQTQVDTSCELIRIDFRSNGPIYFGRLGGRASCPSESTLTAGLGLIRMLDGSYLTGGLYTRDSFDMSGRNRDLGSSPSGVLHGFGMWVGRMSSFNRFAWVVDLHGAGFESLEVPPRTLTASPLGRFWLAMSAQTNNVVELVYDDADAEIVPTGNIGAAEGIVVEFDASGRRVKHSRLRCAGGADCAVLPLAMARSANDRLYLGGTAFGGSVEVESLDGGVGLSIPTGVGGDAEGWLVAYDAVGMPGWARHFKPDASESYGAYVVSLVAVPDGILGTVGSSHYARTRLGTGAFAYLAPSELAEPWVDEFRGYWLEIDEMGAVRAADHIRPTGAVAWAIATDGDRRIVAGVADGLSNPSGALGDDFDNPFVAQIDSWETLVAQPSTTLANVTGDVDGAAPTAVVVSPHGVTMAAAITGPCTVGAGAHSIAVDPPEGKDIAVIWRLNSARELECQ